MKVIAATSALLALLTLSSAAPTERRQNSYLAFIRPTKTSLYRVFSGAVQYGVSYGKVSKAPGQSDYTTLVTFEIPPAYSGRQCEFGFNLVTPSYPPPTGTKQFDVFTALGPATHTTTDWPSGNLRDQHIGRLQAVAGGEAVNVAGLPPVVGKKFACPADGRLYAAELVGAGDLLQIEWDATTGAEGPYIKVY
jgi:hypothetical protein